MKYLKKRSHKLILYSLLSLLLIWAYFKFDNWVTFGEISGVVINERTKQPVEGAIVFIHWQSEIRKFERYLGPSVYVAETITDKMGRFRFETSSYIKTKSSIRIGDYSPSFGVIKEGYGLYSTSIRHTKERRFLKVISYKPKSYGSVKIQLPEASLEDVMNETLKSRTRSFVINIRDMTRPHSCFTNEIPRTMDALNTMVSKTDSTHHSTTGYLSIISILRNSVCQKEK